MRTLLLLLLMLQGCQSIMSDGADSNGLYALSPTITVRMLEGSDRDSLYIKGIVADATPNTNVYNSSEHYRTETIGIGGTVLLTVHNRDAVTLIATDYGNDTLLLNQYILHNDAEVYKHSVYDTLEMSCGRRAWNIIEVGYHYE